MFFRHEGRRGGFKAAASSVTLAALVALACAGAAGCSAQSIEDATEFAVETAEAAKTAGNAALSVRMFAVDDPNDNIFLDAFVNTGYELDSQRDQGMMWEYVPWTDKGSRGWLTGIGYGTGSTGLETDEAGMPDIEAFRRGGLVCASYVSYVYFNYLPHVAGVDMSGLAMPENPRLANSWYEAAKVWVDSGHAHYIDFEASESANWITFTEKEEMPVGSLVFFTDARNPSDYSSHVAIYAGFVDGHHWLMHVGNENGPEFCAIERMRFGPDPQWPLAVVSRPDVLG